MKLKTEKEWKNRIEQDDVFSTNNFETSRGTKEEIKSLRGES